MTAADFSDELVFAEPPPLRRVDVPPVLELVVEAPPPRRAPSDYVAPDSHRPHGTYVKYVQELCRCRACRDANREYEAARQSAIRRREWQPYIPAGPARAHLRALATAGVGPKTVAKLAGVSHGSLAKIVYGDPRRGLAPSKRIRRETSEKILAVTIDQADGAQKIPAGPTWELLDDLIARGYTKSFLARALGNKGPGLQVKRTTVRASTARKVEELHRRLAGRPGPGRRSRWSS
jgi:hypothetical protein